jgi:hypothetical protein
MADERSQSSRPTWRGNAKPTPVARPKKTDYKWTDRGTKPDIAPKRPGSRPFRVLGGLAAFAACLGMVIWLILMINPPEPAALVLVGADYATNLAVPHNALGWEGLKGIEQLSREPRRRVLFNPAELQLIKPRKILDRADQWDEVITDLKSKGFRERTLIIVLALHGGSDPSGAYLMPNTMTGPEQRLEMKRVIDSMKELPAEKQKVLVIEGAQVPADWRLGMLHNDFPRQLLALEPAIREVPNLWVLSGCAENQRCWASEGLGRTIFTHAIIEALRGKAAAGADGRLTLDELHNYVRKTVRSWAWEARGALQEPMLLPGHRDETAGKSSAQGAEAGAADRSQPGTVHLAMVEGAAPAGPPAPPGADVLREAWRPFRQLDALVPHPSVYSPMRWRSYRAALIRYEQLLRCGATDSAKAMAIPLGNLEQVLRKERLLPELAPASEVSLAMTAVAGGTVTPPPDPPEFLRLAEAPADAEAEPIWKDLQAGAAAALQDPGLGRSLRNRLDEFLLNRAAGDPVRYLRRAAERIKLSKGSDDPLPAEAHLLVMLRKYLPLEQRPPAAWSPVKQALQVRRLAERAALGLADRPEGYPYSEQVHAWTAAILDRGDEHRCEGEDHLFAADERAWSQARDSLNAAETQYRRAVRQAGLIRAALAIRDRAAAELPDYSRWLVHRPLEDLRDDLAGLVEDLWTQTHRLAELLVQPRDGVEPSAIDQAARLVAEGLKTVSDRFERQRSRAEKTRLEDDWEAATAAAAIAFPGDDPMSFRAGIWRRLEDIRKNDLEVAAKVTAGSSAVSAGSAGSEADPARLTAEIARRRAALEGTLALAALGQRWFSDPTFKDLVDQGDYRKTLESVRALAVPGKDPDAWWTEATRQGSRIGRRFRELAGEIARLSNEERGITDFPAFQSRLAQAESLSRLVDPATDPPAGTAAEPAARLRQARVHDLLLGMAQRTWSDHWYDEKPEAKPYYQESVARLLGVAEKLFPELGELHQKLREGLLAPGRLDLDGPERLVLTSEFEAPAAYRVVARGPGKVPPGSPVARPRLDPLLQLAEGTADFRLAPRGEPGAGLIFRLTSPAVREAERRQAEGDPSFTRPVIQPALLTVEGFFRGQVFARRSSVELHPVPDTVAIGAAPPDPPLASLAVKANSQIIERFGQGTGSIAIVLDCSGSMKFDGDGSKWKHAKSALTQVLQQVPQGTTVSIWTFSQLPPGVTENDVTRESPIYLEPERTISQLRAPSAWDPNQVAGLTQQFEQLRPYLGTPLVQAMWTAAEKDLVNAKGLKTLLVLTDGTDTRFLDNANFNPSRMSIPAFIGTRFRSLGVRINVVYFSAFGLDQELKKARDNFEKPLEQLDPPGKFIPAANLNELIASLRGAINQALVCHLAKADGTPLGVEPLAVTNPNEDLRWWSQGLTAGTYKLRVVADKTYGTEVDILKGDRLVVQLVEGPDGGIAFERALYGDDDRFHDAVKQERGDWRLTVLSNQQVRRNQVDGLRQFVALESKSRIAPLRQVKPGLVWFRLGVEGLSDPAAALALRWREWSASSIEIQGYPAPVWKLDVPQWPVAPAGDGLARPILTTWWRDPARPLPGTEFQRDGSGGPQQVRVDDNQTVLVEDVRLEDHLVEVQPGEPPKVRSCLVIRLAYPKDSPYLVDPEPIQRIDTAGYEHRFYGQAGKYAGLFWPVNMAQFQDLHTFRLVSLNRLRNEAGKLKNTAEVKLARPQSDDKPPDPPQAILR